MEEGRRHRISCLQSLAQCWVTSPTLTHSKRSLFAQKGVKGVGCDKRSNLDVLRNLSVRPKAIHPGQVLAGQPYQ